MIANIAWYRRRYMVPVNMLFCWHLGLTMMLCWWAVILAILRPTFTISAAYSVFASICPDERFWAIGYAVAAAAGFAGCWAAWPAAMRQHERRRAGVRMLSALMMAFIHGMTAIFMFRGAPTGTGPGIYVLIMCSAYLLLRAEYERS